MKDITHSTRRNLKKLQPSATTEHERKEYSSATGMSDSRNLEILGSRDHSGIDPQAVAQVIAGLEKELIACKAALNSRDLECARLLRHLTDTQELINLKAKAKERSEDEISNHLHRLNSILKHNPEILEADQISITANEDCGDNATRWHIGRLYLNDKLLRNVEFNLSISNGLAVISSERDPYSANYNDWIDSPANLMWGDVLSLGVEQGDAHSGTNANLSKLGTTGWLTFKSLTKKMADYIEHGHSGRLPVIIDRQVVVIGLRRLQKTLEGWPQLFRYDQVSLVSASKGYNYSYIEIELNNVSIGTRIWANISFRLATADTNGDAFGTHPRLEFGNEKSSVLEYWRYAKKTAAASPLELRFAIPDAMDIDVWGALPVNDKFLITGIIGTLIQQLEILQTLPTSTNPDWGAWKNLSLVICEIFKSRQRGG